ncbi:MAG: LysM peptidoglycan-binding domain-containing protein [Actinobacteria bacterium]|uniref:Unannotated protein n=1 Tax=freshwater metagenome TaxID=449393 RepID=A0A6J6GYJ6_9ZZZZ|nr:LysM peptidoglycan-binding domain-containing protein [Actinomycetota bacterium]
MRSTTSTFRLALASLTVALATTAGTVALPTATAAAAPARTSTAGQYVVQRNDTLFDIARAMQVSLSSLLSVNRLTADSVIHPGMVLLVPAGGVVPSTATPSTPARTTTTASSPSTAAAPAGSYVVQRNDSIFSIAQKHGLKMGPLMKANNLTVDSVLVPGRTLTIPAGGTLVVSPAPAAPGPATPSPAPAPAGAPAGSYMVVRGDSIFSIAQKHGVKMGPLMKANNLTMQSILVPGRSLTIPSGGTVPAPAPAAPTAPATPVPGELSPDAAARIETVVSYARAQLGKPWEFAKAGPDSFDCSGLTRMAYLQIGINLPHSSVLQANRGVAVDWFTQDIRAGDLIFMATSDAPGVIGHVGIAIDSTRWIHSPRAGDVVRQGFIPADSRLLAVRRYVNG